MRLPVILMSTGLIALVIGCSSSQKSKVETPPASPTPAPVASPTPAAAPKKEEPKQGELTCARGKESRTLRIEAVSPKGCKLWYSHYSTKDPVASSQIADTHCKKVHDIIRGRLEGAGFKCGEEAVAPSATPVATPAPAASATPAPAASPAKK